MFRNPFKRKKYFNGQIEQQQKEYPEVKTDEQIINVVGRDEQLDFLDKLFLSDEDLNILYNGSPASAKL
jgi:hypothetical protein